MNPAEKWSDVVLDAHRQMADPLADEVVARIVEQKGPEEAQRLFDLLIHQLETPVAALPAIVDEFLHATRELPAGTDFGQVAEAQTLFCDHGPKFLLVLYYKSLPLLYSCARGAEVLVRTSRLTTQDPSLRVFARRIAETGQFLIDVMTPGGLAPGAQGIVSIQKVRLIHAAIRQFLSQEGWDHTALGRPVNQEDMALTLLTFSIALVDALEQFGIEESPGRQAAFVHTWNAVGRLLGVTEALLPADVPQARHLMKRILERQAAPSEAGRLLTRALIEFANEVVPSQKLRRAPAALIRFFSGEEHARLLGISTPPGCLSFLGPQLLSALFRLGERLEDQARGPVPLLLDQLSRHTARAMVHYFNTYKGRSFHIPESMRETWFTET